jgi:LGFP repeat
MTLVLSLMTSIQISLFSMGQSPVGEIAKKWQELGGEQGLLGKPTTDEMDVPGLPGARAEEFEHGIVCWCSQTGAHLLLGAISARWAAMRDGRGVLGCPITDEQDASQYGRHSDFQYGFIYWTGKTGAHEVYGDIGKKWAEMGREKSRLGDPITGERSEGDRRISRFEHGYIYASPEDGVIVGPSYTFRLDKYHIDNTRSRHEDTNVVHFTLKIGDQPIQQLDLPRKNVNNGDHGVNLTFGSLFIDSTERINMTFQIVNAGHAGEADVQNALEQGANMLSTAATASGHVWAVAAVKLFQIFGIALLNPDCDGPVAADAVSATGATLYEWTEKGDHSETRFYPDLIPLLAAEATTQ